MPEGDRELADLHVDEPESERAAYAAAPGPYDAVLALQKSAGNLAVHRALSAGGYVPSARPATPVIQRAWNKASFPSAEASLNYHWNKHGKPFGKTKAQYTSDAEAHYAANKAKGVPWTLSDGSQGIKIKGQPGGIYTASGEIVTFWYD